VTERWRKRRDVANDGKALIVWFKDGYEICMNVNKGLDVKQGHLDAKGHRWWYEVTFGNVVVGEHPGLSGAKKLAKAHRDGESPEAAPEVEQAPERPTKPKKKKKKKSSSARDKLRALLR
jgi:hypothetical protein